jgi:hypothetical protein
MMSRRQLLQSSAVLGMLAGSSLRLFGARSENDGKESAASPVVRPLPPPGRGSIPVAFLISEGAVMIDFAGPWGVFQDVNIPSRSDPRFQLYTVAETAAPIHASGGMKVVPDYTIENAPAPKVIVIPAQSPAREKTKEWIRQARHLPWSIRGKAGYTRIRTRSMPGFMSKPRNIHCAQYAGWIQTGLSNPFIRARPTTSAVRRTNGTSTTRLITSRKDSRTCCIMRPSIRRIE